MANETSIVARSGDTTTTTIAHDGAPSMRRDEDMPAGAAFVIGLLIGSLGVWLIQKWTRRKVAVALKTADNGTSDVKALKDRLETLETIVTDKPGRLAKQIDSLVQTADSKL